MYDYIIVGQGLAGTLLAYTLWKKDYRVLVIDECKSSTSSLIAGGVYNPVTGRRLVKSWQVDELLPFMTQTYLEIEELLNVKILYPTKILRLFRDDSELEILWKKRDEYDTAKYLGLLQREAPIADLNEVKGYCEILGGGWIDTKILVEKFSDFFNKNEMLLTERFDHNVLETGGEYILYNNISAKKLIFCEGYECTNNPFFKYLPFNLVKGEMLIVQIPGLSEEYILNKGILLTPMGNSLFKAGGTYNWNDLTENLTEAGKNEITAKLDDILAIPYTIINHQAGIRPASVDRRPMLGSHPVFFEKIYIFNGLGTKGALLAPMMSEILARHMNESYFIDNEINIRRFKA
jgi:glycine oxidase